MAILGPFKPIYPVDFRSGGDTTTAAFGKHIQEIERIYGIINSLDADKISASEITDKLNEHINSSAPHPNLALSSLLGNLDIARITGNLAASRVSGTLSNANINTDKVNNLETYVKNLISSGMQKGTFECEAPDGYVRGYATFPMFNQEWQICFGIEQVQDFGSVDVNETSIRTIYFKRAFPEHLAAVSLTLRDKDDVVGQHKNWVPMLGPWWRKNYVSYHLEHPAAQTDTSASNMEISYIAIGH